MFPSDIVGVIATFLPPTTRHQQRLMLVNHTWYQGVVEQDGMQPKPNINWPLDAMKQRKPRKLVFRGSRQKLPKHLASLVDIEQGHGTPFVEGLNLTNFTLDVEECALLVHLGCLSHLTCATFTKNAVDHLRYLKEAEEQIVWKSLTSLELTAHDDFEWNLDYIVEILCETLNASPLTHFSMAEADVARDWWSRPVLTDVALKSITAHWSQTLESLNFEVFSNFTDEGMKYLSTLQHLTRLNCGSCKNVTDSGFSHFLAQQKVGKPISDLRIYGIHNAIDISSDTLQHFTSLRKLELLANRMNIPHFRTCLSKMTMLKELHVNGGVDDFEGIQTLFRLTTLKISYSFLNDDAIEAIAQCESLTSLSLWVLDFVTTSGFACLGKLKNSLRALEVVQCPQADDVWVQTICSLTQLTRLSLHGSANNWLHKENIVLLCTKLPLLSALEIGSLKGCSPDETLSVIGEKLQGRLQHLSLLDIDIGSTSLQHIARLHESLRRLELYYVDWNDNDEGDAPLLLMNLVHQLSDLEELALENCSWVTLDCIQRIRAGCLVTVKYRGDEKEVSTSSSSSTTAATSTTISGCGVDAVDEKETQLPFSSGRAENDHFLESGDLW